VRDRGRVRAQAEPRGRIDSFSLRSQGFRKIEQLLFGQPDQRTAQQRPQRDRIARVGEGAHKRDKVLDLLPPEEILARLRAERQRCFLQGVFIAPQLGSRRRQERNVARRQQMRRAISASHPDITDETRTSFRDDSGFHVADVIDTRLRNNLDPDLRHARETVFRRRSR
jgi:hypothetical protein